MFYAWELVNLRVDPSLQCTLSIVYASQGACSDGKDGTEAPLPVVELFKRQVCSPLVDSGLIWQMLLHRA